VWPAVADAPSLDQLFRRAVDAQVAYYRAVGQLSVEYARAVLGAVRSAAPATVTAPVSVSAQIPAAAAAPAAPVLALEAEAGSVAGGVFVVENGTAARVSAPVEVPALADGDGRQVAAQLRFEPEVVTLEPGEQTLVQLGVEVTRSFRTGVDYRGEVRVPGLVGTSIPLVVRRLRATPKPKPKPRQRRKAPAA
jgi:hypothetical protein